MLTNFRVTQAAPTCTSRTFPSVPYLFLVVHMLTTSQPSMNEHELSMIFEPKYRVASARILRDSSGHGKGVGFGRFADRETCDRVLAEFNGHNIDRDGRTYQIAIRFADSSVCFIMICTSFSTNTFQEQKNLKHQVQQARSWRSSEYAAVTSGYIADHSFEQYISGASGNARAAERLREVTNHLTPVVSPAKKKVEADVEDNIE